MRFTSALLALPLISSAAAAEAGAFEQYKAKFQNFLGSFGAASVPGTEKAESVVSAASSAAAAATGKAKSKVVTEPKKIEELTLGDWKETFYAPVIAKGEGEKGQEDWLVLVTGGNKTCYGHCERLEKAFTAAAKPLGSQPANLHLATVNCDSQPVLCNVWSAGTGSLFLFQLPSSIPENTVDIYTRRMNLTTVTEQDVVDAYVKYKAGTEPEDGRLRFYRYANDGWLHPFDGKLARWGVSEPLGYVFWALNAVPSWAMMLVISGVSRYMMNRRMGGADGRPRNAAAGAAPRAAPPGDARS